MKILFVNQGQFGHMAGYYYYCKYLSAMGYEISFICLDQGLKKINLPDVSISYIQQRKGYFWRILMLKKLKVLVKKYKYDAIWCSYFRGCFVLRMMIRKIPMILDIRSGDLSLPKLKRYLFNLFINFESHFFNSVAVTSDSLASLLKLKDAQYSVIPLGAEMISVNEKKYNAIHALYVGSFFRRNIELTIDAVAMLKEEDPRIKISYDIVGFGTEKEEAILKDRIRMHNLSGIIKFHGRKTHAELKTLFDHSNVGITFVPITEYFNCQPSTKTIEYILSGLFCIATSTPENRLVISSNNGILCEDNPYSLCCAFKKFLKDGDRYSSVMIRSTMKEYTWEKIIHDKMLPILEICLNKRKHVNGNGSIC